MQCTAHPFVPGAPGCAPALLSHRPVNLSQPPWDLDQPRSRSSSVSSMFTSPSSRDLLLSHVLMLSHPRLCHLRELRASLCRPEPRSERPHLTAPAPPARPLLRGAAPAPAPGSGGDSSPPSPHLPPAAAPVPAAAEPRNGKPPLFASPRPFTGCAGRPVPLHGSGSRKAPRDGINPFCAGAE